MKALLSPLADQMLADPSAREQLREFAKSTVASAEHGSAVRVRVTANGKTVFYEPIIVKNAA